MKAKSGERECHLGAAEALTSMRALAGALGAYLGVITFILRLKSGAVEANSKQESKICSFGGSPWSSGVPTWNTGGSH
jgi:hypothetical protein